MTELLGVAGMVVLAGVYVGLGLADRGADGCGGCAAAEDDPACGSCGLAAERTDAGATGSRGLSRRTNGHERQRGKR